MSKTKQKWASRLLILCMLMSICAINPNMAEAASVVQKGSSGMDVRNLQYNLNFLCFSVGSIDGIAGTQTINALKAYQRDRNLSVDGMAGPEVWSSLQSEVQPAQQKLYDLGYYNDSIDGVAGPNTVFAMKQFQYDKGLSQTGTLNKETWLAIYRNTNTSSMQAASITDGEYILYSQCGNNYCLDVTGGYTGDCVNMQLYSANGTDSQVFEVRSQGNGYYTLKSKQSGKMVDVELGVAKIGTNVQQYTANGSDAQKWFFQTTGDENCVYICSALDVNLCLDVDNGVAQDGRNVQIYKKNYAAGQRWKLVPAKKHDQTIDSVISETEINKEPEKYKPQVSIRFSDLTAPNTTEGTGVHLSGTISVENGTLSYINAWVENAAGQRVLSTTATANGKHYQLYDSVIDWAMTFGDLSAGEYTLYYEAVANDDTTNQYSLPFSVSGSSSISKDAQTVVSLAQSQEGKPISTYWNWYNGSRRNNTGCALFVSYVARQAGISENVIPTTAGVPGRWYKNKGLYEKSQSRGGNYTPKPGDLIFYDWGYKDGYYWHVEYVTAVSGNKVYAIGTSDSSGKVIQREYSLNSNMIMGYANVQY